MRRAASLFLLVAFFLSCGGHWYVLQGVAWVNMVRDYSEFVPVATAVKMTFSGEFPCKMCKAIADKKQQEDDQITKLPSLKKDFALVPARALSAPVGHALVWDVADVFSTARFPVPLTPPPSFLG